MLKAIITSCNCNGLFSFLCFKIGSRIVGLNKSILSGILLSVLIAFIISALGALKRLLSFPVIISLLGSFNPKTCLFSFLCF